MNKNQKIITLNGTEYSIETQNNQPLTPELINKVAHQLRMKMNITSKLGSNVMKLGTPTCPTSPIPLNTVGTLTASVTQGTAPFTYIWTITKPGGGTDTLPNSAGPHNYTFALTGTYNINLTVNDSCPTGALSNNSSCNIDIVSTTGGISFISYPPGANVYLDGLFIGITNMGLDGVSLDISHNYTLTLTGYNDYSGSITLTTLNPYQIITATLTQLPIAYSMTLYGCDSALSTDLNPSCLLTASCLDQYSLPISCGSIEWSSDDPTIASVDSSGTVTAISNGTVMIVAIAGEMTATKSITVNTITASYTNWVTSKGGAASLKGNLSALGEIIDGYLGMINLGFTVTLANVGQTINYYLGV